MSKEVINKVDKSALDKIRKLIEQEINANQTNDTLKLTEIFKPEGEVPSERFKTETIYDDYEIKQNIRAQIQIVFENELKKSLISSFEVVVRPLLKKYLKSTGNNNETNDKTILHQDGVKKRPVLEKTNNLKSQKNNVIGKVIKNQKLSKSKKVIKGEKDNKFEEILEKLENMTKSELKSVAKEYDLNLDSRRKKETLIIQIKNFLEKK